MNELLDNPPPPDFEIDHREDFARYFLHERREIVFYLEALAKRTCLITAHLDEGERFFLTTILAVDAAGGRIFLDPAQVDELNRQAVAARRITLAATLDRVKVQFRVAAAQPATLDERPALVVPLPATVLRLQRREFFRLEPPADNPIHCRLEAHDGQGHPRNFELMLGDISGGGVSLVADIDDAECFPRAALLGDCRLDIPGEGVIAVELRVRKAIEVSTQSGLHNLRIGCEFVNLPGSRLAMVERYIARIERERKARTSGLL